MNLAMARFDQTQVRRDLSVAETFDAAAEKQRRIGFLSDLLRRAGRDCYVLGISGGVDSTVAGRLAQLSVEALRREDYPARFIAVRLPYGVQRDEADAQAALAFIAPDEVVTIDIKSGADALMQSALTGGVAFADESQRDFALGNIKARQRMVAQYAVAGAQRGLVIGTDHAAEALMGFFTKFGDGGCDAAPLYGLNKRRVRAVGRQLGAPEPLVVKVPTADLETLRPQLPDEASYGITYEEIDDFLEGKPVAPRTFDIIRAAYLSSAHKRALPITPD